VDDAIGSLGEAMQFGPGYETFWTYIPHFIHSPFYVYAYAFGDCLVNSLYARLPGSRRRLPEKYFDMLKAGGTKHHSELLAVRAGCERPGVLAQGTCDDRRLHRRAGTAGGRLNAMAAA
jgi:oligoendopeptidase F